jgi:diguanylate cyclase (GGDEF)-like protein
MSDTRKDFRSAPPNVLRAPDSRAAEAHTPPLGFLFLLILRIATYVAGRPRQRVLESCLLSMVGIAAIDVVAGRAISIFILYLIPIGFATQVGRRAGFVTSLASAFISVAVDLLEGQLDPSVELVLWNGSVRFALFLIVSNAVSAVILMQQYVDTDYLTGLLNRRGFYKYADKEIHRSRRMGRGFSVVYLDIDNFKPINDRFGHKAGDRLLQSVARALQQTCRKTDLIARLGGDEFAIVLTDTSFEASVAVIKHLCHSLQVAISSGGWGVTPSFGVATYEETPESVDAALEWTDRLMYDAKQRGGDSVTHEYVRGSAVIDRRVVDGCTASPAKNVS